MPAIKLRKAIVYLATGVFFLVVATAQLQDADVSSAFLKGGIACAVVTISGIIVMHTIEGALRKQTAPAIQAAQQTTQQTALAPAQSNSTVIKQQEAAG